MNEPPVTVVWCLITTAVSLLAFRNPRLKEKLLFRPKNILADKEWYRLFSGALIHADFMHLGFNLLSFYAFAELLEWERGPYVMSLIYVGAILGGSVLSLFLHRHHEYSALGASGGVCGVIFASIFLVPGTSVSLGLLPVYIPGPIYAVLYLVGTFYALRRGGDNIGHDAHFGGAIVGLLFALAFAPKACFMSPILFSSSLIVATGGLLFLARNPLALPHSKLSCAKETEFKPNVRYQRYDEAADRREQEEEIDRILEKVSAQGVDSLSKKEKSILDEASSKLQRH